MAIDGLLLDLEGVLYTGSEPVPGAREAITELHAGPRPMRFITNTTVRPRREVAERLQALGFAIPTAHIFTPAAAVRGLLAEQGLSRLHLAAPPALGEDFAGFEIVEQDPQAVVMGDLHLGFDWPLLNRLFGMLRGGARLVALHRNRYCRRDGGIGLDLGPFVAALEYAAGVEAIVVGKPSAEFFRLALADLGTRAERTLMVGDDILADIDGAQRIGLRGVQVRTGKFDPRDRTPVEPAAIIDSIADLPAWLKKR